MAGVRRLRLLLDTHVWLWLNGEPARLARRARDLLEESGNKLVLSIASVAEISIKWQRGKLKLPEPPALWMPHMLAGSHAEVLAIELAHALRTSELRVVQ